MISRARSAPATNLATLPLLRIFNTDFIMPQHYWHAPVRYYERQSGPPPAP
jgi:hypothetical protein